jgi:hypothetical protein
LEAGLATQFVVMPKAIQQLSIPDKVLDMCRTTDYALSRKLYLASTIFNESNFINDTIQKTASQGWDDNGWIESDHLMADISFRRSKLLRVGSKHAKTQVEHPQVL